MEQFPGRVAEPEKRFTILVDQISLILADAHGRRFGARESVDDRVPDDQA